MTDHRQETALEHIGLLGSLARFDCLIKQSDITFSKDDAFKRCADLTAQNFVNRLLVGVCIKNGVTKLVIPEEKRFYHQAVEAILNQ